MVGQQSGATPLHEMNERLSALAQKQGNRRCADCCSIRPDWVSFFRLKNSSQELGVFICRNCAKLHTHELGEKRCVLKSMEKIHEFNIDDIELLEASGNTRINDILEAYLNNQEFEKAYIKRDKDKEIARRARFINDKYRTRKYSDDIDFHKLLLHLLEKKRGITTRQPEIRPAKDHRESLKETRMRMHKSFSNSTVCMSSNSPKSNSNEYPLSLSDHRTLNRRPSSKKNGSCVFHEPAESNNIQVPHQQQPSTTKKLDVVKPAGRLTQQLNRRLSNKLVLGRRKSTQNLMLLSSLNEATMGNTPAASTMTRVQRRKSQAALKSILAAPERAAPIAPGQEVKEPTKVQHTTSKQPISMSNESETQVLQAQNNEKYAHGTTGLELNDPRTNQHRPGSISDSYTAVPQTAEPVSKKFQVGMTIRDLFQPAYNEIKFDTRIERDLGYRVRDPAVRDRIEGEVYHSKPQPQFGFDPTVPGAYKGDGPLVIKAHYRANAGTLLGRDGNNDTSVVNEHMIDHAPPTNLTAARKGYVMPQENEREFDLFMKNYGNENQAVDGQRSPAPPQA